MIKHLEYYSNLQPVLNYKSSTCKEHFRCIFDENPIISLFIHPQTGQIVDANEMACKFYGYSRQVLRTMNIAEINIMSKDEIFIKMKSAIDHFEQHKNFKLFKFQHKLSSGEIQHVEVYCSKINLFGDEVIYSQIIDISKRKRAETMLQQSENRFRTLVEQSPDAILVCQNDNIVFINDKVISLFQASCSEDIYTRSVLDFVTPLDLEKAEKRLCDLYKNHQNINKIECKLMDIKGRYIDVEISATYILYNGEDSIQVVIRNMSEIKKDINRAVDIQRNNLIKKFPLENKAILNNVWIPAKGVSGDFYQFHKVNDDLVLGIVGDVSGKGVSAALSVSAMKVMFYQSLNFSKEPVEILNYINTLVSDYLGEDYVAALCFSIDFKENILKVVSAGTNEFLILTNEDIRKSFVKGPFLGMFLNSHFGQSIFSFASGSKIIFYTDGLNDIFEEEKISKETFEMDSFKICRQLKKNIYNHYETRDDCTCLIIDII